MTTSATFTREGLLLGARMTVPLLPGLAFFASAFGAAAAQKGLSLDQAVGMSALVYAGVSQLVALEVWREVWSPSALLEIATLTAIINARLILMSASLQPWMAREPVWRSAGNLLFLTDANWLIGTRYRAEGGQDLGVLFGAGFALWLLWVGATVPGFLVGALASDPKRLGLDLLMPIFFVILLVPLWRGRKSVFPWAVAGAVALVARVLVPGYAFIVIGALAGALAGAVLDDEH